MSGSGKRLLAAAVVAAAAGSARADMFSPGPLAKAHANLEGINNCTQCHAKGSQLSPARCLSCHAEVKERLDARHGFHGRLAPADLACNKCHHEHQGHNAQLIDWGRGKDKFDHRKTGFPLEGKHAQTSCDQCHTDRLLGDAAIRALRAKEPGRTTFLGAAVECAACHFDEHRGQLNNACKTCHTEAAWKPAPGFNHAKTEYPLQGKHARVECLKCHARTLDADAHKDAVVPPRSEVFQRFHPVSHASCVDCHKDPHEGRLGENCMGCHTVADWLEVKAASGARAFHEKTRFPLRGGHADVACKSCHGPFPGVRAVFKEMRFGACADCHVDAHLGQLGSPPVACDSCHSIQSFLPARYEPAKHTTYPLQGAHAVVACSACHRTDAGLAPKALGIRAFLEKRGRVDRVSLIQLHPRVDAQRCDVCHADAHHGQFAARVKNAGCADCHQVQSFAQVRFDHAKDSSFVLTGAHAKASCAACHVPDTSGVVRYKPVAAQCATCHADAHAGQFALAPRAVTDCARCHSTGDWKQIAFAHRPPWTRFELQGKHASVACTACHREVQVADKVRARQYKGLPATCAGCHVDTHKGAFREFGL